LSGRYGIFIEMADFNNIVAVISTGTTSEGCDELVDALKDIAARDKLPALPPLPGTPTLFKKIMKPRDAWFAPAKKVPLAEARGRISAEAVAVYPPGVPALNPGEEITDDIYEYLRRIREMRLPCHGLSDTTLKTIKIVIE
jgi:arginine decarboxylase